MGRRRTHPEEDVEIGATASPAVGAIGATTDVFEVAAKGELVAEEVVVVVGVVDDETEPTIFRSFLLRDALLIRRSVDDNL